MVKYSSESQTRVFQALSDPTRREMLRLIASRDLTVAEIGAPFPVSAPAISKHLKVLEKAELITRLRDGKKRRFKLNTQPLFEARETISELASFWSRRLDRLDQVLKSQPKPN